MEREMDKVEFKATIEAYINRTLKFVEEYGGVHPHITIFADIKDPQNEDEQKQAVLHLDMPDELLESEEGKETFMTKVFPQLAKKVKEKFNVYGITWMSEGWMRTINKNEEMPDNYKDLPIKKEVIIVSIETIENNEGRMFELKRDGKQVTPSGEFVDKIELIPIGNEDGDSMKNVGGRFSGMLKQLIN
jgi:hypothetical protein